MRSRYFILTPVYSHIWGWSSLFLGLSGICLQKLRIALVPRLGTTSPNGRLSLLGVVTDHAVAPTRRTIVLIYCLHGLDIFSLSCPACSLFSTTSVLFKTLESASYFSYGRSRAALSGVTDSQFIPVVQDHDDPFWVLDPRKITTASLLSDRLSYIALHLTSFVLDCQSCECLCFTFQETVSLEHHQCCKLTIGLANFFQLWSRIIDGSFPARHCRYLLLYLDQIYTLPRPRHNRRPENRALAIAIVERL